jgi:hypothetical protein
MSVDSEEEEELDLDEEEEDEDNAVLEDDDNDVVVPSTGTRTRAKREKKTALPAQVREPWFFFFAMSCCFHIVVLQATPLARPRGGPGRGKIRAGAAGDVVRLNSAVKKMITAACAWPESTYFTHAVLRQELEDYYDHVTTPIDLKANKAKDVCGVFVFILFCLIRRCRIGR